ncbi:MAG: S-methyl-5-thioribose-1-phosphate isomerase [Ardenticatenaceae bacterium]|nr:S-methyl-5-thioribose-1-phosphate isomerase [Anaerolineales bacterium]MCB8922721.1 S-methyl-5-thioribose-1-phosphate isomerase [Ardenticatenaceae bacterium]MCB9003574.1 S-methyl-5-thioribose-1-phosphate isomerase [Ardenticatenaceae bacterium]
MRTVFWDYERGTVKMIDQRLLPWEFEVAEFDDYTAVARAIKDMVVRGAPAIGAAAGFGMALAAQQSQAKDRPTLLRDLETAAATLNAARPTAVNLAWAVARQRQAAQNAADIRAALLQEAQHIADEDVEINRRMAYHGAELISDGDTILHHCNTGALATVDWGTALGVIFAAHEQGKRIHVLVDETRPRLQGARLTAWELKERGIPFDLIADNAAGHFMRTGQVNIVLVGSDRTAANGDVANKIGTYKLAVVAKENGVPFYPVVPTSTIDLSLANGDLIPIEERDASEVLSVFGKSIAPEGISARNPAFDVTPHRYVTGIVTEAGVVYPPFVKHLREAVNSVQ